MDAWFGNSEAVRRKHYASTKDLSEARRLFSGSWNVDSSSCSVHSETAHSSPSRPTSEKPFDTEEGKTLNYALKKLFQIDVDPEEPLVKHIRRESNPQPSVPKTDALSNWATDACLELKIFPKPCFCNSHKLKNLHSWRCLFYHRPLINAAKWIFRCSRWFVYMSISSQNLSLYPSL